MDTILNNEDRLTQLDQEVGDGDLGLNSARAARSMSKAIDHLDLDLQLKSSFLKMAKLVNNDFGGTSGPLWATFIEAVA